MWCKWEILAKLATWWVWYIFIGEESQMVDLHTLNESLYLFKSFYISQESTSSVSIITLLCHFVSGISANKPARSVSYHAPTGNSRPQFNSSSKKKTMFHTKKHWILTVCIVFVKGIKTLKWRSSYVVLYL